MVAPEWAAGGEARAMSLAAALRGTLMQLSVPAAQLVAEFAAVLRVYLAAARCGSAARWGTARLLSFVSAFAEELFARESRTSLGCSWRIFADDPKILIPVEAPIRSRDWVVHSISIGLFFHSFLFSGRESANEHATNSSAVERAVEVQGRRDHRSIDGSSDRSRRDDV